MARVVSKTGLPFASYASVLIGRSGEPVLAHTVCNDSQRPVSWQYIGKAVLSMAGLGAVNCAICTVLLGQRAVNVKTLEPIHVPR